MKNKMSHAFQLDQLESRLLRSASLAHGVLTITGTKNADVITVNNAPADKLRVSINGVGTNYRLALVKAIRANLGNGNDTYTSGAAVTIKQAIKGGNGEDQITGGAANDDLQGGDQDDVLNGGAGDDRLWGEAGDDEIDGGLGNNTVMYDDAFHATDGLGGVFGRGVTVHLPEAGDFTDQNGRQSVTDSSNEDDTLINISNIVATKFRDLLTGNRGANLFHAGDGDDNVDAGDGDDSIFGDAGADILHGEGGDDEIWGGQGDDQMSGGAQTDTLHYDDDFHIKAGVGVSVKLAGSPRFDSFFNGLPGENDSPFSDFENLVGTPFNDTLIGNETANVIDGLAGDDNILGQRGNDTLIGGLGMDRIFGGDGDDTISNAIGRFNFTDGGEGTDTAEVSIDDEFFSIEAPTLIQ